MDVCDTGNSNDGTNSSFLYFNLIQTVKLIQFADLYFFLFVRIVMVDNDCFLVDFQGTVVDFTDTDTANVFVVIDGTCLLYTSPSPRDRG